MSCYPLSDFSYIRSFITRGKFAVNCVELVTQSDNWGLIVSSFLPSGGHKFFSLVSETENKKAKNLCETLANYTLLSNKAFQEYQFCKTPIESKNESSFIKNLF